MESSGSVDANLRCEYALRVALQTMKERCVTLQRRLTSIEEENQELRAGPEEKTPVSNGNAKIGGAAENLQLRLQVAELTRQKTQLTEHINMVSNENRKLWSRLSQIAKEQSNKPIAADDMDRITVEDAEQQEIVSNVRASGGENQNLIRSKTFTKHSPNPHLRHKVMPGKMSKDDEELSLEEVALHVYDNTEGGGGEDYAQIEDAQLGFGYLKVEETSANDTDFNLEAKKCIESLKEMRREAMRQQEDLNSTLAVLGRKVARQPCPECAKKTKKPEMADKSLETDESLSETKAYNGEIIHEKPNYSHNLLERAPLNIIQEKIEMDSMDKTCPMCGKIYGSLVSFDSYREHVEMHFIDDSSDVENSMERNFEFISHTLGDF